METAETKTKLAGAIRTLQAKGDTASIDRLVNAYKVKYRSGTDQPDAGIPTNPESSIGEVAPTFKASMGGAGSIIPNVAKTFANIPSNAANLADNLLLKPVVNVAKSVGATYGIYKDRGAVEGTKDIAKGFGDVASTIFKTPGQALVAKNDQMGLIDQLTPQQKIAQTQRDEILAKIDVAKKTGADTSHLVRALQYNQETLGGIDNQVGTKEDRNLNAINTISNVVKYPIERPLDIPAALYAGPNKEGQDLISRIASPITRGADTSISNVATKTAQGVGILPSQSGAVDQLEASYSEWASGTKPGKKMIGKLNAKTDALNGAGTEGRTPMRVLAEDGIVPKTSGTKFDTLEQAKEYRQGITKLREANRSALEEVGLSTQQRSLDDLQRSAVEYARTPENINSGNFDKMKAEIDYEFGLLKKNYPSGTIPLSTVDDIKSARWDNVFKNKGMVQSDVLKKDSEYAIAKAMQKDIEAAATAAGHTEVAQLNREIGDKLEGAKLLESFDGNTIKGGRLGKYVGTVIGSSLGTTLPGKIVGALGGNAVADLLIKSSVSSPLRRVILNKLKTTDPEAYSATLKWLGEQDAARVTRLALPSGEGSPINLPGTPSPTTYEAPAGLINREKPSEQLMLPAGKPGTIPGATIQLPTSARETNLGLDEVRNANQLKSPANQQTNAAMTNTANIPSTIPDKAPNVNTSGIPRNTNIISEKATALTKENGGVTINLKGDTPTKGYAYSPFKDVETKVPKANFSHENVDAFVDKHFDKLTQDGNHLGLWEDDGNIYIDISKVHADEQTAVADSIKNNQLGLFDLSTFETKYIKDYEKIGSTYKHKGQK